MKKKLFTLIFYTQMAHSRKCFTEYYLKQYFTYLVNFSKFFRFVFGVKRLQVTDCHAFWLASYTKFIADAQCASLR